MPKVDEIKNTLLLALNAQRFFIVSEIIKML